jgi:hypothetical protein
MPFGKEGGMPCATIWNLNNVQRRVLQRSTGVWEKASRESREHSHSFSRGVSRQRGPCSVSTFNRRAPSHFFALA